MGDQAGENGVESVRVISDSTILNGVDFR